MSHQHPDETTCTAEQFAVRHIGPDADARTVMLTRLGYESLTDLIDAAVPASIRDPRPLNRQPGLLHAAAYSADVR